MESLKSLEILWELNTPNFVGIANSQFFFKFYRGKILAVHARRFVRCSLGFVGAAGPAC